jgi:hypothetical protein
LPRHAPEISTGPASNGPEARQSTASFIVPSVPIVPLALASAWAPSSWEELTETRSSL